MVPNPYQSSEKPLGPAPTRLRWAFRSRGLRPAKLLVGVVMVLALIVLATQAMHFLRS